MTLVFSEIGFDPDFVDYQRAWTMQRELHEAVTTGAAPSTVLLLEHSPVYTAGKRTEDHERPTDGTPVIPVDRGGKLTWHGPGQLVGYPILKLRDPHAVREYVWLLEDALIAVLGDYGIAGSRVDGRAGIWLAEPDRKIASIGIRVHNGATMHGFSLNCDNDIAPFGQIIACGIANTGATTISQEAGRRVTPAHIAPKIRRQLALREAELIGSSTTEPGVEGIGQKSSEEEETVREGASP